MRRAKIVATLGPATSSYENIRAIIDAGVDVARMNLSHGTYAVHEEVYANVRRAATESGRAVAVLVDLQGPKIRLGKFEDGPYDLSVGDVFKITTEDILGTKQICSTTYKGLPDDVKAGDPLLIDDGKVTLRVTDTDGTVVTTVVEVPGAVSNNKGINLPGVAVNVPALSDKDEADLRWGLKLGADLIALSFVRNADDIVRVHEIMAEEGRKVPVIAKIEKPQAVDNLEAIIDAFDAIMVARGDLGVELPLEAVPIVQKHAIELARRMAKPVIVATQMLESMISSPRPDPRGDLGCRQRRARRRRRGHAQRRDQRGAVPGRDGADHGPHHRIHRKPRPGTHPGAGHETAHPGRRGDPRRRRGGSVRRREVSCRFHRVRRLGAADGAAAPAASRSSRSRPRTPSGAGWRWSGACRPTWSSASPAPTRSSSSSMTCSSVTTSSRRGEKVMVVAGFPPGTSAPRTTCACTTSVTRTAASPRRTGKPRASRPSDTFPVECGCRAAAPLDRFALARLRAA